MSDLDDPNFVAAELDRIASWKPDRSVVFTAIEGQGRGIAELLVRHGRDGEHYDVRVSREYVKDGFTVNRTPMLRADWASAHTVVRALLRAVLRAETLRRHPTASGEELVALDGAAEIPAWAEPFLYINRTASDAAPKKPTR